MQNMSSSQNVRLLFVIPGKSEGNSFIFSKREYAYISQVIPDVRQYFFDTKLSFHSIWRQLAEIRKIVRDENINVIHSQYGTITGFICLIARQNAKLVTTFRGSDLGWNPSSSVIRNLFSKLLSYLVLYFCDYAILVSRSLCRQHSLFNPCSIILPTGVNRDEFFPTDRLEAQGELGWNKDRFHVLFNSGKDPINKRLDLAEAAIELVRRKCPEVELHVMRGDIPAELVPIWMNASNLLLLLSDLEGSPTVVQEALACGTPVVAVAVGDTVERLSGRSDSLIVKKDVNSIVLGIEEIINKKVTKPVSVQEDFEFDYKRICQKIVEVYQKTIKNEL